MDVNGSWALVTGASPGIGEVFARELAERGANLVLAARSRDRLEALANELGGHGGTSVEFVAVDLSEPGDGARLAGQLERRGRDIDVLVNNAGFGLFGPFHEADAKRIAQQVQLNVAALTELTCALLPGMRARDRGAIVNVASTAAFQPVPYMAVYGATKAYVLEDEAGEQPVAVVIAEQRPLIGELLVAERVCAREDPPERSPEPGPSRQSRGERSGAAPQELLSRSQARAFEDQARVEQEHRIQLERKPSVEIAREQLGCDRAAHVVCDEHDPLGPGSRHDRLDEVGLGQQLVQLIARFV
jgi:hypothetical protein